MCQFIQMIANAAEGTYQGTIQNAQNDGKYTVQTAQTDAANMLSQDSADNNNAIRSANNEFAASQASLQNTQRSIGNQQKAMVLGSQNDALVENQARAQDTMIRGNVESGIAAAAELGALNAQAAARGVGGSSADIMRSTMAGRNARLQVGQVTAAAETSFDSVMAQAGLRSNLLMSQDYGTTVANMNYQASIPTTTIQPAKQPDLTYAQMELMGAAGGGGFQQFSNGSGNTTTVGGGSSSMAFSTGGVSTNGDVGNSGGYSSNAIINGVSNTDYGGSSSTTSNGGWNLGGSSDSGSSGNSGGFNFSLS